MKERDPRVDPMAGDVLRIGRCDVQVRGTRAKRVGFNRYLSMVCYHLREFPDRPRWEDYEASMDSWAIFAKGGEVIYRSEREPQ